MGKTNSKKKVGSDNVAQTTSPVVMMEEEEPQEEEPREEETWDVIKVIGDSKEEACDCRTEGCGAKAVAIWQSTLDPHGEDAWPLCDPCQEKDFGGWPDDKANLSATTTTITTTESKPEASVASAVDEAAGTTDGTATKEIDGKGITVTATENAKADAGDDDWDLKKILPVEEITKFPIQCDEEECNLLAAVVWTASKDPTQKWRGCLDCQNLHFGGWPDAADEFPVKHMTEEHKAFLLDKCSRQQDAKMPEFLESPTKGNSETTLSNTLITPPPNAGVLVTQQKKNGKGTKPKITPSPAGGVAGQQQPNKKKSAASQYNKKQAEKIREWNEAAARMGGGPRAIIDNAAAKEMIFKFLYDTFRPMNINTIYKEIKAIVPSPILRNCLEDMAFDTDSSMQFADDSDDDNEDGDAAKKNKKKSSKKKEAEAEPYTGVLSFKTTTKGGANAHLYHVNYNIAKNGDGLDSEEKNKLASAHAAAEAEKAELERSIKSMESETAKLLSEPTNEEAAALLEEGEENLKKLNQDLEALHKLTVNEKHKQSLQRRIDSMTKSWRQRKRLCMDFLVSMEENTDGTVSLKKCLAGNGQIEIDSDEAVAEGAKAYAKNKRAAPRGGLGGQKLAKKSKSSHSNSNDQAGIPPSASFVAVLLNSKGLVQRVHVDDDEDAMGTSM